MGDPRVMFRFRVWPDGSEPYTVDSTMRDVIRWERTTRTKAVGLEHLRATAYTTDLVKIAYFASVRHGLYAGTAQEFEDACDWAVLPDDRAEDAQQALVDAAADWRRDESTSEQLREAVDRFLDVQSGAPVDPTRPVP